jgi:hypothetical protein
MVTLAASSDPLVRAVAAESIGEEIWRDPAKQARVNEIGGVDVLLGIAANKTEPVESLLPALWSLRNALHDQPQAKTQFGYRDGISIMNSVVRRGFAGMYAEQSEKVFEAVLACLSTAALHDERNSRRLLMVALPVVLDLADGRITHATVFEGEGGNFNNSVGTLGGTVSGTIQSSRVQSQVLGGMRGEGVNSLAKALLLQLAPYNYVVCRNCHKRQDLHGTTCYNCGHPLLVEPDITEIELRKTFERQSSTLSKTLGLSPTKGKSVGSMSMSTSLKGAGVGGLRKLAEERAREKEQRDHAGGGMAGDGGLNTSVRGSSSNMRLHSPQPLPSSVSERRAGTGTWESKLAETGAERTGAVSMSQTMPLPLPGADGTYTSGSAGSSRPPAGALKGKPPGAAKMMLSKSAAALDRALVGADQMNAGGARSGTGGDRSAVSEDKSGDK